MVLSRNLKDEWAKQAKVVLSSTDNVQSPVITQESGQNRVKTVAASSFQFPDVVQLATAEVAPSLLHFYLSRRRVVLWDPKKLYGIKPVCARNNRTTKQPCRSTDLRQKQYTHLEVLDAHDTFLLIGIIYECKSCTRKYLTSQASLLPQLRFTTYLKVFQ